MFECYNLSDVSLFCLLSIQCVTQTAKVTRCSFRAPRDSNGLKKETCVMHRCSLSFSIHSELNSMMRDSVVGWVTVQRINTVPLFASVWLKIHLQFKKKVVWIVCMIRGWEICTTEWDFAFQVTIKIVGEIRVKLKSVFRPCAL